MTEKSNSTNNGDAATKNDYSTLVKPLISGLYIVGFLNVLYKACVEAYNIRLYAINEFGRVIHEFDPYFNYRAAEVRFCFAKSHPVSKVDSLKFPNLTKTLLFALCDLAITIVNLFLLS